MAADLSAEAAGAVAGVTTIKHPISAARAVMEKTEHVLLAGGGAEECETLEAAMARVGEEIEPGDVLLLSPGCASWDQFPNFEERGRLFGELLRSRFVG